MIISILKGCRYRKERYIFVVFLHFDANNDDVPKIDLIMLLPILGGYLLSSHNNGRFLTCKELPIVDRKCLINYM